MATDTGPGTYYIDRANCSEREHRFAFFIDNFDIDGYDLKPEHRAELDRRFRQNWVSGSDGFIYPVDRMYVFLRGYASRTGHSLSQPNSHQSHNDWLSQQRVNAVRNFLLRYVSPRYITSTNNTDHVGDRYSNGPRAEDDRFRAVQVIVTGIARPREPIQQNVIDRFAIRVSGGIIDGVINSGTAATESLSDFPGLGALQFAFLRVQIKKITDGTICNYVYVGLQASAGISLSSLLTSSLGNYLNLSQGVIQQSEIAVQLIQGHLNGIISAANYGPWSYFIAQSNHHVQFYEFEGDAGFGGMRDISYHNYFSFDTFNSSDYVHIFSINNNRVDRSNNTIELEVPSPPWETYLNLNIITLPAFGRLLRI